MNISDERCHVSIRQVFCSKPPAYCVKSIVHISHYKSVKGQFLLGNVLVPAELPVNIKSRVQFVSCCHGGHLVRSKGGKTSCSQKEKITIFLCCCSSGVIIQSVNIPNLNQTNLSQIFYGTLCWIVLII